MELLGVLSAGVRGAENGTVEIYERGTSTFAELFASAEGDGGYVPTAGISLDAHGGVETYCELSVDCVAFDLTGQVVRRFTQMHAAANVEVRSQSFTGTAYSGGAAAASNPAALSALMDLWKTNAGAVDWKVLVGSTATTLQTAFASVSGLFFNVRSTAYGAVGDGVADDTSAIQAAIDAANAFPGGTVYFPGGTYKTSAALTIPSRVSLLGAGARAVNIFLNHATANAIEFAAETAQQTRTIKGLTILPAQANSGKMVAVENGGNVNIEDCTIGGALLNSTGKCISVANASTHITVIGCIFVVNSATGYHVYCPATGNLKLIGTKFIWSATNHTNSDGGLFLAGSYALVLGCVIDLSAVTNAAANGRAIAYDPTGTGAIVCSKIIGPTVGGSIYTLTHGTAHFFEYGLDVPDSGMLHATGVGISSVGNHEGAFHAARAARTGFVLDNTAAVAIPSDTVGGHEVRRTNNGNQTATFDGPLRANEEFTLTWTNDHGAGGGTITIAGSVKGLANFTVNANCVSRYFFKSTLNCPTGGAGTPHIFWVLVGSCVNQTL